MSTSSLQPPQPDIRRAFLLADGELAEPDRLRARLPAAAPCAVVCADGGARHARALGLSPDVIVGDMDSLPPVDQQAFADAGVRLVRYPADKDETDTELAFSAALAYRPDAIWVFGALGYRFDHALANLSLLLRGDALDIPVHLVDAWGEVFCVSGTRSLEGKPGQTVSLLPFGGAAAGVTLSGFAYPLQDARMPLDRPYGVSNRLTEPRAEITVTSGRLLVIRYFDSGCFPGRDAP